MKEQFWLGALSYTTVTLIGASRNQMRVSWMRVHHHSHCVNDAVCPSEMRHLVWTDSSLGTVGSGDKCYMSNPGTGSTPDLLCLQVNLSVNLRNMHIVFCSYSFWFLFNWLSFSEITQCPSSVFHQRTVSDYWWEIVYRPDAIPVS